MKARRESLVEACMVYLQFQAFEIPVEMSELPDKTQSLKRKRNETSHDIYPHNQRKPLFWP